MLAIQKADLLKMYEHCSREYPNEACGILVGKDGTVQKVYALRSEQPSPTFYRIDARDQFRVFKEMRAEAKDLLGIYHSHTGGPAFPSAVDVELAYYPDAVYVIVSLMDRERPLTRGFSIVDGNIAEVALHIIP